MNQDLQAAGQGRPDEPGGGRAQCPSSAGEAPQPGSDASAPPGRSHPGALLGLLRGVIPTGQIGRGAGGVFILRGLSLGLAFATQVILARILGVSGYGAYANAGAWVTLLTVPALLGTDRLLVREIARNQALAGWGAIHGLLRWANRLVLWLSGLLVLAAGLLSWLLAAQFDQQMLASFAVALLMLPFIALLRLRQATMQGLRHVVLSQLPEMLIQPLLFLMLIGGAWLALDGRLSAPQSVALDVAATIAAFLVGSLLLRRVLPAAIPAAAPLYEGQVWLAAALPLLFVTGTQVVINRVDIVMLGAMVGTEAAGAYVVAARGAELITFVLTAVNMALAPAIAALHARGEQAALQRLVTRSARAVLLVSLPLALGMMLFGHWFLLLFGEGFTQARTALLILSAAQALNAAMGSVGLLLMMTGHERDVARGMGLGMALNILLNLVLIPIWAIEGAAAAAAISVAGWNLLLAIFVYKRLRIHSTALGKLF